MNKPSEQQVKEHLSAIQALLEILAADIRRARQEHPEDDHAVESGLFQSAYSLGHLSNEVDLLYDLYGTSKEQIAEERAKSKRTFNVKGEH